MSPRIVGVVTVTGVVLWMIAILYAAFVEGYMLGTPGGTPFTTVLRTARFDVVGRFFISMFFCWFFWHIELRPVYIPPMTRYDLAPLALGIVLALCKGRLWPDGGLSA